MNAVLPRNRSHFGAQITTIPVLHFFSEHYCQKKPLVLLSKNHVSWIYSQLPWVQKCIHSKHPMDASDNLSLHTNIPIKNITQLASLRDLTIDIESVTEHAVHLLESQY